jgi:hypothetical protein
VHNFKSNALAQECGVFAPGRKGAARMSTRERSPSF